MQNQWFSVYILRGYSGILVGNAKGKVKLTSAMILRFVALSASSLPKETLLLRKMSACRSSSSRPHVGDDGTPLGTVVLLPGVSTGKMIFGSSKGFWGSKAPPSADVPATATALPLPMASLAGASAIRRAALSCVACSPTTTSSVEAPESTSMAEGPG